MADTNDFVHLHAHSEYSMLDGGSPMSKLVGKTKEHGQSAVAVTDNGNLYGIPEFYQSARNADIKPIIGLDAFFAFEDRFSRPRLTSKEDENGGDGDDGHKIHYRMPILAYNNQGYKNLIKFSSAAYMDGYHYRARADWDLLEQYHEGLIVLTGGLESHICQALLQGDEPLALQHAARLKDICGENVYVEIQDHNLEPQRRILPGLLRIAEQTGIPLVGTNDTYYTERSDAAAHDAIICVKTGTLLSDQIAARARYRGSEHYLKSSEEMRYLFRDLPSEVCDNTLLIAEKCDVEIEFGKPKLPEFPRPTEFADADSYLKHLTYQGAEKRWGTPIPADAKQRIDYELGVISDMGFSDYFIITWDLIRHAREKRIRVGPGRGSAAGSAVAYTLWITDLDPIKYDLLFERFLNPSRISMPDIDMDFDDRFREEMIHYSSEKYGADHVAQIITFGTIKARNAIRDATRIHGMPFALGDKLAKSVPPLIMGRDTPLWVCLADKPLPKYEDGYKMAGDLRKMYAEDSDAKTVIDTALGIEGLRRNDGIHAAAVVITNDPVTEVVPIQRKPEPDEDPNEVPVVTQYEMHGVEDLGLLKMDFLGLKNLGIIERALDLIERNTGVRPNIDEVDLHDPTTFELLQRGDTVGVFQLESSPMQDLIRRLAPTEFDDIAALVALYRPGPMKTNMHYDYADRKNGRKEIEYIHPDQEELLGETQGLMIYQEQMMRLAQKFAGYTLAEADSLRKACLPAGTKILTRSRGYVPIEKLMSLRDTRVQTIDEHTYVSRHEYVDDVWSVGTKPVFRLTTASGYLIEATDNHPLLVGESWTKLGNINPGDKVAVASRTLTFGGSRYNSAELDLAALLISEGYTPDPTVKQHGTFVNTDEELLTTFEEAWLNHFNEPAPERQWTGNVATIRFNRKRLIDLGRIIGKYGTAEFKMIPNRIINGPTHAVERFLGLYFCADGWADKAGIHYGSKSEKVCRSLKRMLLRLGVTSTLNYRDIEDHGRHWVLSVTDKPQTLKLLETIRPHLTTAETAKVERKTPFWDSRGCAVRMGILTEIVRSEVVCRSEATNASLYSMNITGPAQLNTEMMHRNTVDGLFYSEKLHDLARGDLTWDTVVSVEYVGDKECYDFQMRNGERPYAVIEDFLVHNCGKKVREIMQQERAKFVTSTAGNGYTAALGTALFDIIEPFADYGFNKSHSYGYGLVAYQTAWLKANYPAEYMAALLTNSKSDKDKMAVFLADCRHIDVTVSVPDINKSETDFVGVGKEITFGMSGVRNVGEGIVERITNERDKNGPFKDFFDFCERMDSSSLNKRTVEALIKGGAFDSLGHPRRGLLDIMEDVIDKAASRKKEKDAGLVSLFDAPMAEDVEYEDFRVPIPDVEFDKAERLSLEREMLGLYVSDHPLSGLGRALERSVEVSIANLNQIEDGKIVTVGGVIATLEKKYTKKGDLMGIFVLEDLSGSVEVVMFPKTFEEHGEQLAKDKVMIFRCRVDRREDKAKLNVIDVVPSKFVVTDLPVLDITLPERHLTPMLLDALDEILRSHVGDAPVVLRVNGTGRQLPLRVSLTQELIAEVGVLMGPDAVQSV